MQRNIVRQLVSDCDMKVIDRVGAVVAELEARHAERGFQPLDTDVLIERIAAAGGRELANKVEEAFNEIANLHGDAGFLVGYETKTNPDWLILNDGTD